MSRLARALRRLAELSAECFGVFGHGIHLVTAFNIAVFVHQSQLSGGRLNPYFVLAYGVLASIALDLLIGRYPGIPKQGAALRPLLAATSMLIPIGTALVVAVSVVVAVVTLPELMAGHPLRLLGAALVVGLFNATLGSVAAHELIHSPHRLARWIGGLVLATSCHFTFYREHTHGHHQDAATPADPSTARLGESLFRFLPRAISGNARKAFAIEKRRLAACGEPFLSPGNATLNLALCSAGLVLVLSAGISPAAGLFFVVQACFAVTTLETLNYVQHYGLLRRIDAAGRPEPIGPQHSFDSPYWFSNLGLLNLLRHSDHHVSRDRSYPYLRTLDNSPKLPFPIFAMMLLAALPPLWRWVMDPRARAANELR